LSFGRDTPVLQLSEAPKRKFAPVLLPVWVHAVTSPLARAGTLDVFQSAALALIAAGVSDFDELCELMNLKPTLCKTVAARLAERGLLMPDRTVTAEGLNALAHGAADDAEPHFLRCFQDPDTQQLLPRILVSDPMRADTRARRERFVEIEFGSSGKPVRRRALILRAAPPAARQPTDREVIEACRRHDRATRGEPSQAVPLQGGPPTRSPARMGPVRFHGPATSAYLVCFLREGEDRTGRGWYAEDPFAVGETTVFSDLIAAMDKDDELSALLEKLTGATRQESARGVREAEANARRRIEVGLERVFGTALRDDRELLEKLVAIDLGIERGTPHDREDVARLVIRIFEYLLPRANRDFPPAAPRPPSAAERVREREFVLTAQKIGAASVPAVLRQAAKSPRKDLSGEMVRAVQAAADNPKHPLGPFLGARPNLLADLDQARERRNRATHAETNAPPAAALAQLRELAHDAVRHLGGQYL
jgi:hypothetical protein